MEVREASFLSFRLGVKYVDTLKKGICPNSRPRMDVEEIGTRGTSCLWTVSQCG